jgi:phage-related minor tail protein
MPGRATGGPVSPGRPYVVGERGPELFVPTASGRVETGPGVGGRDVRLSITINAPAGAEPRALEQSSRQIARAAKRALTQLGD